MLNQLTVPGGRLKRNAFNKQYDRHGDGEFGQCDMPCWGDSETTCGGYDAFDLYSLEWAEPSNSEEYLGCFADRKADRVLGDMMVADDMKDMVCREHCVKNDALFYATQVNYIRAGGCACFAWGDAARVCLRKTSDTVPGAVR